VVDGACHSSPPLSADLWAERLTALAVADDSGALLIPTPLLALPAASVADDTEVMGRLQRWVRSGSPQPPLRGTPLTAVDASLQGVVRLDALLHYLADPAMLFGAAESSWGAKGPLGVRLDDGRVVLVDGNHRWVAALLAGRPTLLMQVLR